MIVVAGRWELEMNTNPDIEIWLWSYPIRDFGIKDWYMWPITNVKNKEWAVNLHEREHLRDILEENKHLEFVFVEPEKPGDPNEKHGGVMLDKFDHPKDVLYIFGSAHTRSTNYKKEGDLSLVIPTIHDAGVLWPHQCLVTILYDRLIKRGKEEWQ